MQVWEVSISQVFPLKDNNQTVFDKATCTVIEAIQSIFLIKDTHKS